MPELNSRLNEPDISRRAVTGDDLLPPVEPPTAGFIVQLFVLPALIVLVIVGVWLTFSWIVNRTSARPEDLIQGLEYGPRIARWQRASELADLLRNERFIEFKRSPAAATQLADILKREIDRAGSGDGMEEGDVTLRYFLTRALGEFEVEEGLDALLKAADTRRDPREQLVRYGALEAIAVRVFNLRRLDPPVELNHPELMPTLVKLAGDEDPLIRSATAYALGQIGSPEAIERLALMVEDPDADTRYNAAVALAHHGNAKAIETIAEMLDLEVLAEIPQDQRVAGRSFTQAVIVTNAIHAAEALAEKNPKAEFSLIIDALKRLVAGDAAALAKAHVPSSVRSDASRALEQLQSRRDEIDGPRVRNA